MEVCQEVQDAENVVLSKKEELLGELAATLAICFSVSPVVSTAIVEHVFQELLRQFYQKGETYLPNFGHFRYSKEGGSCEILLCDSFLRNLDRMKEANKSEDSLSMALIERKAALCQIEK